MLHKKTIPSNLNQNKTKTDKIEKNATKIALAYVHFYKTKLHRGRKRR